MTDYTKPKLISLKAHPEYSEKWVQNIIADDPTILGLGDLVLRDQERIQPRAGRLDLLLQDRDTKRRYEVELQLGATDEAHIIRTIEYWDIERKRYPQYDHAAVIVAENITSRFLNVMSLFNGTIPLIALQMQAIKVGEHTTLIFTTVMDELIRGLVDDDEDAESAPTDRSFWETKASKGTVGQADKVLTIVKEFDEQLELKYNKFYIGMAKNGQAFNFVAMRPKRNQINLEIKIPRSEKIDSKIEEAEFDALEYNQRYQNYRIRLVENEISQKRNQLKELMEIAYHIRMGNN